MFAFSPFRFEHYNHLEIVWSCWIPLSLWALHRTIATGRWSFGILTGLCIAAQVFSCVYLAVFLATWLAVIGVLMLALRMLDVRSQAFRALAAGAIVGAVVVAPYGSALHEQLAHRRHALDRGNAVVQRQGRATISRAPATNLVVRLDRGRLG